MIAKALNPKIQVFPLFVNIGKYRLTISSLNQSCQPTNTLKS